MTMAFLFDCLWQGAIVTLIAWLVARFGARGASTRYAVWFVALCALVAVPAFTLFVPLHVPSLAWPSQAAPVTRLRMTLVSVEAAGASASAWTWLITAWALGVAAMLARLALSALRVAQVRRRATPVIVGTSVVLASTDVATPVAAGVFSPVVIIPRHVIDALPSPDLQRVIAHERGHIERGDIAANYFARVVEAVLFFNPFVHIIGRRLVEEREAACDDLAVAATGPSHDYAACLASLAQTLARRSTPIVSPSVFGSRNALVHRIARLLSDDAFRSVRPNYSTIAATSLLFALTAFALKPFAPVIAATPISSQRTASASATCSIPDAQVKVLNPAMPDVPHSAHPKRPTLLRVAVAADGIPTSVDMLQSSGDIKADGAAADAATHSTYRVAVRDCKAVTGTYIFRVDYAPD